MINPKSKSVLGRKLTAKRYIKNKVLGSKFYPMALFEDFGIAGAEHTLIRYNKTFIMFDHFIIRIFTHAGAPYFLNETSYRDIKVITADTFNSLLFLRYVRKNLEGLLKLSLKHISYD